MTDTQSSPHDAVRALLRVRQVRDFTDEPVSVEQLDAIADVGRWSGSSTNSQPWRFIVVRDIAALREIAQAGLPQTRSLQTAQAAIAIALPVTSERNRELSYAYDEGRAAERILASAYMLGLAAGIGWIFPAVLPRVREVLDVPQDWLVRTIVAIGHPTEAARQPKNPVGEARKPRDEIVFDGRFGW